MAQLAEQSLLIPERNEVNIVRVIKLDFDKVDQPVQAPFTEAATSY